MKPTEDTILEHAWAVAIQALADLGPTADVVAKRLFEQGFAGCPLRADNCPVANYLITKLKEAEVPAPLYVSVFNSGGIICRDDLPDLTKCWNNWRHVPMPGPVSDFIRRFDGGEFPELRTVRPG